jgi:hypothetical protein
MAENEVRRAQPEFLTVLRDFSEFGERYCANVKRVISTDLHPVIDIYQEGLSGAMSGLTEVLTEEYESLAPDSKEQVNREVRTSGALPMLRKANGTIGAESGPLAAVKAISKFFPKIKKLIRGWIGVDEGSITDKILNGIDTIIENIDALVPG